MRSLSLSCKETATGCWPTIMVDVGIGLEGWYAIVSLVDNCSTSLHMFFDPNASGIGAFGMRRNRRSEPVVQPTAAYGRCVAGNGGVLSVLTMHSRVFPACDHREMVIWILPAVGGEEARLCGKVNVSEVLINPVRGTELKLLFKAPCQKACRRFIGLVVR